MGLPKAVQNLVILIFAEQTNRSFYLHGAPTEATLATMPDQMELRTWVGPPEEKWKLAVQRAGSVFGLTPSPLLNANTYRAVMEHEQARWQRQSRRLERVEMSARLVRWLVRQQGTDSVAPASLAQAAQQHALWGGFVDWARNMLLGGEPGRELADAYVQLFGAGARVPRAAESAFRQSSA